MNRFLARVGSSLIVLFAVAAIAQTPNPAPAPHKPSQQDLYIQESGNGIEFAKARLLLKGGEAPSALRDGKGRVVVLFDWHPAETNGSTGIAMVSSTDEGQPWTNPEPIVLRGLPGGYREPSSPTVVLLEEGKIRLYFTSCATLRSKQQMIYSALSSDAFHYVFEPGVRFGIEDGKTSVSDCAVARSGKMFHLCAPISGQFGRGYHALSEGGLRFQRLADITMQPPREWLGNLMSFRDGLGFFGTSMGEMWIGFSRDGVGWRAETRNGEHWGG